ncbi:hypothetical protein B5C02_12145 [Staphylococcus pseudintermedius]|uniref:hypothetical protein n=1 Tax=Staphylococcus pseudintermedius TaxID=283734 RepID=UPI000BBC3CBD|nr:hypothetical protein [Staphylococcus pseudintermedius]PCF64401.1 hypothetical protein B5C02_12145 [Staphylococcus pseudintermedius]
MSLQKIIELNRIYRLYLVRRLLDFGILKSNVIRWSLLLISLVLFGIVSVSGYVFISQIAINEESIRLLINSYTSSAVMWTTLIVLALKVVFSKSQDFFKIMENFPITNKIKNLSIFIFESVFSLVFLFFASISFILSIILNSSLENAGYLLVNIFYVSTVTYLVLQLISKIVSVVCSILKIEKLYFLVNISILLIIFIAIYKRSISLTKSLTDDYINHESKTQSVLLLFNDSYQNFGFLITTLIFVLLLAIIVFLIFILPDNSYSIQSKYINIFENIKKPNIFKIYILAYLRDKNVLGNIIGAYLFAILLLSINLDEYILFTLLLVVFNSIYCFVQTMRIRLICYSLNYSYIKDYAFLLFSQLLVTYVTSIPLLIIYLYLNTLSLNVVIPYIVITVGTFILVLGGILFPPYNDNPFSIIVSFLIISVPLIFILVVVTFLNLSFILNTIVFIAMLVFIIYFSILALNHTEKRYRNEKFTIFN